MAQCRSAEEILAAAQIQILFVVGSVTVLARVTQCFEFLCILLFVCVLVSFSAYLNSVMDRLQLQFMVYQIPLVSPSLVSVSHLSCLMSVCFMLYSSCHICLIMVPVSCCSRAGR